jgi:hypothetical protein
MKHTLACLILLSASLVAQGPQGALTVCDVMKQPQALNGKTIILKGPVLVEKGGYAEKLLPPAGESCTVPKSSVQAQIRLNYPEYHVLENPPKGFKLDQDSTVRFREAVKRAYLRNPSGRNTVNVVVEGILMVNKPRKPGLQRDSWYPADLIVESYKSIEPE